MALKKLYPVIILILYTVFLIVLWFNSQNPSFKDIPILYVVGFVVSVVYAIIPKSNGFSNIMGVINLVLFLLCIIHLIGVYGFLKSIFMAD